MDSFIINFTPTGMVPTRDLSPYVPIEPAEIIREVLDARQYGISIVHLHARDEHGKPTWRKEIFQEIIDGIRAEDGYGENALIICVSTSGRHWPDFERRSECLVCGNLNSYQCFSIYFFDRSRRSDGDIVGVM